MDLVRLHGRKTLLYFLKSVYESCNGDSLPCHIFVEPSISSLLSFTIDTADLNDLGFKNIHTLSNGLNFTDLIYSIICDIPFKPQNNDFKTQTIICVYICHPSFEYVKILSNYLITFQNSIQRVHLNLATSIRNIIGFIPSYTISALQMLHKLITPYHIIPECYSIHVYWVPIDENTLSMEYRNIFVDYHLYKEETSLQLAANSLYWLLNYTNSLTARIYAIGSAATSLLNYFYEVNETETTIRNDYKPFNWSNLFDVSNVDSTQQKAVLPKKNVLETAIPIKYSFSTKSVVPVTSYESGYNNKLDECPLSFDQVIILDRRCDMYTLMATPFAYHALLDFTFSVQKTYVEIPTNKVAHENIRSNSWKLALAGDTLFPSLKDLRLKEVGIYLHKKAHELQSLYQEKDGLRDIAEIGEFVRKLKGKQSEQGTLANHVNIATFLNDYYTKNYLSVKRLELEDSIMANSLINSSVSGVVRGISNRLGEALSVGFQVEDPLESLIDQRGIEINEVYRILCLACLVEGGFKNKIQFERIKKQIVRVFGFQELSRLNFLATLGLLKYETNKFYSWSILKKNLRLLMNEEESENDISCVYSGYAPASVRLVELLCNESDKPVSVRGDSSKEILDNVWGPCVEVRCNEVNFKPQSCLVIFVGGVTLGEVTCLRKLQFLIGKEIYIGATEIFNHKILFDSLKAYRTC
ncbi:Sec1 family protein [Cryptosporidium serpentis]